MKNNGIFCGGYANLYEHTFENVNGKVQKEHVVGKICENKLDLPTNYEFDKVTHKYVGIAKVTIEI